MLYGITYTIVQTFRIRWLQISEWFGMQIAKKQRTVFDVLQFLLNDEFKVWISDGIEFSQIKCQYFKCSQEVHRTISAWQKLEKWNNLLVPCIEIRYNNFRKASYRKKMSQFCHWFFYYFGLNLIKLWPGRFRVPYIGLIGNPYENKLTNYDVWNNVVLGFWTRPFLQIHEFDTKTVFIWHIKGTMGLFREIVGNLMVFHVENVKKVS